MSGKHLRNLCSTTWNLFWNIVKHSHVHDQIEILYKNESYLVIYEGSFSGRYKFVVLNKDSLSEVVIHYHLLLSS